MMHLERGLVPFWSDDMIDWRHTDAELSVNRPVKKEVVMVFDKPWEGNMTDFFNIVRDPDKFRMYYEAWSIHYFEGKDPEEKPNVCYAESRDGIHWERPDLGLHEWRGDRHNNILFNNIEDNFTVMRDENPACPPEYRYKALMQQSSARLDLPGGTEWQEGMRENSLVCLTSADGIHFAEYCVISRGESYDSQNSLHWNRHTGKYYCYFRNIHVNPQGNDGNLVEMHVRGIMVSESEDMLHWSKPVLLDFGGSEDYPLYTNCVHAYPYDDRYYVGFPTRYVERKEWTANFERLCGREDRLERMKTQRRFGLAITDCVFMSSKDNVNWYRFDEACIAPGPENFGNWLYGDGYPALGGLFETPSTFPEEPSELSLLVKNHHWVDAPVELIRYTYRRDGFAGVKAGYKPKTLRTKAFTFEGEELAVNFRTSARGYMYVRVLDENNVLIPGYESCEMFGDSPERMVDFEKPWKELAGKKISLEFSLRDGEIYALRLK